MGGATMLKVGVHSIAYGVCSTPESYRSVCYVKQSICKHCAEHITIQQRCALNIIQQRCANYWTLHSKSINLLCWGLGLTELESQVQSTLTTTSSSVSKPAHFQTPNLLTKSGHQPGCLSNSTSTTAEGAPAAKGLFLHQILVTTCSQFGWRWVKRENRRRGRGK